MAKVYSDKLFSINSKKGSLEINKKEVREIAEYKAILERDRGKKVEGDHDGRKKYFAHRELYYVYIMADPFTMYSILNEENRHIQALKTTKLVEHKGWKPDKLIKAAIKKYKEDIPLSPIAHAYMNARKSLHNIGKDLELYNTYSDELREKIRVEKELLYDFDTKEEDKEQYKSNLKSYIKELKVNSNEILDITSTLPDRLKALEDLKTKLAEEDNERRLVVGGGQTYSRENPN